MTRRHNHGKGRAGFTLLEMLLVMLILGLVAALVVPAVWRRSPQARVEADATRVASALRVTRAAAISRNQEMSVFINTDRRTVTSPVVPLAHLDPDIEVGMVFAAQERRSAAEGGVRFFPNGQSSGGEIRLRLGPAQSSVLVNWATGYAGLSR